MTTQGFIEGGRESVALGFSPPRKSFPTPGFEDTYIRMYNTQLMGYKVSGFHVDEEALSAVGTYVV